MRVLYRKHHKQLEILPGRSSVMFGIVQFVAAGNQSKMSITEEKYSFMPKCF